MMRAPWHFQALLVYIHVPVQTVHCSVWLLVYKAVVTPYWWCVFCKVRHKCIGVTYRIPV